MRENTKFKGADFEWTFLFDILRWNWTIFLSLQKQLPFLYRLFLFDKLKAWGQLFKAGLALILG